MDKASKGAAQNLGLSRNEYNELASTLGAGLKNKGIKDYADQTRNLLGLSSDLSAQFGGPTKQAAEALASAMRGETDPIERYGVSLNATMLEAEAYSTGIVKRTKDTEAIKVAQNKAILAQRDYNEALREHGKGSNEYLRAEAALAGANSRLSKAMEGKKTQLTDQEKAQAALSLIQKQTTDAQGAFGRESETAAGQQQRLKAQLDNVKASLGEGLLPVLTDGGKVLNDTVVPAVQGFVDEWKAGTGAGGEARDVVSSLADKLKSAAGFLVDHKQVVLGLAGAYATYRVGMVAYTTATNVATAATKAAGVAKKIYHGVEKAFHAAQAAWKAGTYSYAAAQRVYTATVNGGTGAVKARTVAEKAGLAFAKTRLFFTKAQTVAQRALNAVMNMSPIGKVILAITALVAGLVLLYKKNATFRNFINKLWASIKVAVGRVVAWFRNTALPWMRDALTKIGAAASRLWTNHIRPAFSKIKSIAASVFGWIRSTGLPWVRTAIGAIGKVVSWLWTNVYKRYFTFILNRVKSVFGWIKNTGVPAVRGAFQVIGDKASWLWKKAKSAFDNMRTGIGKVKDAFKTAKDGIGRIWSGLTSTISRPIGIALGWIENNFLSKVRSVLNAIGAGDLAKKIPTLGSNPNGGKGGKGRYDAGGFYTGGRPGGRARGGILPGYTPMHRGDDQLTPMRSGEGVLVSEGLRDHHSRSMFLAANEAAKRGVPFAKFMGGGYASGGIVALGKRLQGMGYHVSEHPAFGGVAPGAHSATGWHYKAGALDVNADPFNSKFSNEMAALDKLNAMLRRDGWNTIWRAANHFDHLHVDIGNGQGGGLPGGGGILGGLAGKVIDQGKSALNALLSKAPGDFWTQAGVGAMRKITGVIAEKARSMFGSSDTGDMPGGAPGGGVDRWRTTVRKALFMTGQSPLLVGTVLRRMMQESGGNPRAINNWDINAKRGDPSKGLMQVIGSTFRAYAMKGYDRDIYDPLSNILASFRYAIATYGSLSNAYNRAGGYARGTRSAASGPAWVGERGPELLWFRGGERVMPHRQSMRLAASDGPGRLLVTGELKLRDGRAYIEGIAEDVYSDLSTGAAALGRTA
ncbi:transglycosylase SLT domain-containing protein [Janibacter melonis]|uniref:Transglycosylase SLT domain-containing protein n=2 Tax=Janibacter melonis TaxID=262209 RepID=A0A5P8FRW2_9MICO|nr:transglycosylase SLT domain-containing protein [Janibacter melonis]